MAYQVLLESMRRETPANSYLSTLYVFTGAGENAEPRAHQKD